jgi:hypothetical protein
MCSVCLLLPEVLHGDFLSCHCCILALRSHVFWEITLTATHVFGLFTWKTWKCWIRGSFERTIRATVPQLAWQEQVTFFYFIMKCWWCLFFTRQKTLSWIFIVLAHWNNNLLRSPYGPFETAQWKCCAPFLQIFVMKSGARTIKHIYFVSLDIYLHSSILTYLLTFISSSLS